MAGPDIEALVVRYCLRPTHAETFDRTMDRLVAAGVPIRVHDNTRHNLGLSRARNRLLAQATAECVVLMDFDLDWDHLDFGLMADGARLAGVGMVTPVSDGFAARWGGEDADDWQPIRRCACQCMVVRRDLLMAMGGLDERYFVAYADWDLLNRMAVSGLALRQHNRSRLTAHLGLSGELPTKRPIWDRDRAAYRAVWGETAWN